MKLSPRAAGFAVFLARPFPCAVEFQPSEIEHDIRGLGVCTDTHVHRNRPASARKRRMVRGWNAGVHEIEEAPHKPLCLAQRQSINSSQEQGRFDSEVREPSLATGRLAYRCSPTINDLLLDPETNVTTLNQPTIIF